MTLTDPLLKELKGHIAKLVLGGTTTTNGARCSSSSDPSPSFDDENETIFLLCHCIEAILLKGLVRHDGFTPWRADVFSWFYQLVRKYQKVIPLAFKLAFDEVLNDTKARTHVGKTRLLIRACLRRKCLAVPIQFHVENQDWNDLNLRVNYNQVGSVMGHEILSQIFLSLIQQLGHYNFNLDLANSSFLDESLQIPKLVRVEFVPCERLGLTMGFPLGFAVIVEILEHSLAAEMSKTIAVGDIMDDFNGTPVRNFYGSKIDSLFKKNRNRPFKITFVKATDSKGQLYLPAIKLYRILGLDPEKLVYSKSHPLIRNNEEDADDDERERPDEIDLELTNAQHEENLLDHKIGECINTKMSSLQLLSSLELPRPSHDQGILIPDLIPTQPSTSPPQEGLNQLDSFVTKSCKGNVDSLIDIDLNNSPSSSSSPVGPLLQGMSNSNLILNDEKEQLKSKDPFHCPSQDNQNKEEPRHPRHVTESQNPASPYYYEEDNTRPYLV